MTHASLMLDSALNSWKPSKYLIEEKIAATITEEKYEQHQMGPHVVERRKLQRYFAIFRTAEEESRLTRKYPGEIIMPFKQ